MATNDIVIRRQSIAQLGLDIIPFLKCKKTKSKITEELAGKPL